MRYHEIITETMNSPYRWTHKAFATYLDMESWSASFKTDADLSYLVDIWVPREESSVDVSFRLLTGASRWWGRENTGDAFRVMATVRDILLQYIESQHPDQIIAEADEENRARLYSRMLSGIPNYTMKTEQGGVGTKFILTRSILVENSIGNLGNVELISSQEFRDIDVVAKKIKNRDFSVTVSPEFEYNGKKYRVVLDGHHSLTAALEAGVNPDFTEANVSNNDTIAFLNKGDIEGFLEVTHAGDDYYNPITGHPTNF